MLPSTTFSPIGISGGGSLLLAGGPGAVVGPDRSGGGASAAVGAAVDLVVSLGPDTLPPAPDPMTFAVAPAATGTTGISMTASTANDPSGVEYYFTETSGNPGGSDSGWQDSPSYTDAGLTPETQYSYTITARDKSINQNGTAASSAASATTEAASNATDYPTADLDGDGASDREEYLWGLDPNDFGK